MKDIIVKIDLVNETLKIEDVITFEMLEEIYKEILKIKINRKNITYVH